MQVECWWKLYRLYRTVPHGFVKKKKKEEYLERCYLLFLVLRGLVTQIRCKILIIKEGFKTIRSINQNWPSIGVAYLIPCQISGNSLMTILGFTFLLTPVHVSACMGPAPTTCLTFSISDSLKKRLSGESKLSSKSHFICHLALSCWLFLAYN